MFGNTNNDDTTQTDQSVTDAPDAVAMTSEAPSYLPTVPTTGADDTATSSSTDDAALDSLVSAQEDHTDTEAAAPSAPPTPVDASDLLKLKAQALQQLTPLVGHLEQSAEDRFRTFMMMIQASDDKSLITSAYEAAQGIEDEKVRAQALLDVVNEINYFTQQEQTSEEK